MVSDGQITFVYEVCLSKMKKMRGSVTEVCIDLTIFNFRHKYKFV